MVEVRVEQEKKTTCFLVGEQSKTSQEETAPLELLGLVHTLGFEEVGFINVHIREVNPAYGLGTGKAQEIADKAKAVNADCIIFDWEISPTKQRNWESLTGKSVLDRNEVIIRIFAQRASTKEATLQVNLARLQYSLPRLSHFYTDLARQRGGAFGAKGSGETQLELDRRRIEDKIVQIKKELEQVENIRKTQRKQRERTAQASCALVGYTNAGKSSLLNALTGANVFVENKLFATLDPTTRKLALSEASFILLTDTVGFISNLPHTLIKAFRSTLEEAAYADLLLVVIDANDEENLMQYEQVQKVLQEIGADNIEQQVVLNKIDLVCNDPVRMTLLDSRFPNAIKVSANTLFGFEELLDIIKDKLLGIERTFIVPMEQSSLVELVRKNGTIQSEEWLEDGIHLKARLHGTIENNVASSRTLSLLMPYLVQMEVL